MQVEIGPKLGQAMSLSIECADCGHSRWRRVPEFYRFGFTAETPIDTLSRVLYCSPCRDEGLPGKNIVVQAAFATPDVQRKAENWAAIKNQTARAAG